MSRALLSEVCECGESWRCLPSGLRTATTECVLWKRCVLGRVGAEKFSAEGFVEMECSLKRINSRGNRRGTQEMV